MSTSDVDKFPFLVWSPLPVLANIDDVGVSIKLV